MPLQRLLLSNAPSLTTAPIATRTLTATATVSTLHSFRAAFRQHAPLRRNFHTRTSTFSMAAVAPASPSAAAAASAVSRGALIVLEGLDRSGKSSQCVMLAEALNKNKSGSAVQMRFPGRSSSSIDRSQQGLTGAHCRLHTHSASPFCTVCPRCRPHDGHWSDDRRIFEAECRYRRSVRRHAHQPVHQPQAAGNAAAQSSHMSGVMQSMHLTSVPLHRAGRVSLI